MKTAENLKKLKSYFKKYFSQQWLTEEDEEFKALVRLINKSNKKYHKERVNAINNSEQFKDFTLTWGFQRGQPCFDNFKEEFEQLLKQ